MNTKKILFFSLFIIIVSYITILFSPNLFALINDEDDHTFDFFITISELDVDGNEILSLEGDSDYGITTSSYSIYMIENKANCAIHLLNFKTKPDVGVYDVENREFLTTGAVCMIDRGESKERIFSESGTFVITELEENRTVLTGHFDMIMIGNSTGKKYSFKGNVKSALKH